MADRTVLEAFGRAIDREAHNLSRWPELLWQQGHNRLQWEDEPVPGLLEPERARRSTHGRSPWIRTRTPFREARGLLRTLEGHTGPVWGCAVAPDGSFVVSVSLDKTLKLWDAASGRIVMSTPFLGELRCVALHPALPLVALGDQGGSLYQVDLVGIEYGPIVVSAVDTGAGPKLRCPGCWQMFSLDDAWLGHVMDCPTPSCDRSLGVNPFIVKRGRSSDV
ncbi:MAG: WD40 repeat domain-containing protein [Gaiellaceae bacterium]